MGSESPTDLASLGRIFVLEDTGYQRVYPAYLPGPPIPLDS